MLAIGDPNQLLASVTRQKKIDFGFNKSHFDRLMFGCGEDHNVLNTQCIINPAISKFSNKIGTSSGKFSTFIFGKRCSQYATVTNGYKPQMTSCYSLKWLIFSRIE